MRYSRRCPNYEHGACDRIMSKSATPRLISQAFLDGLVLPVLRTVHVDPCAHADAIVPTSVRFDGITADGMQQRWHELGRNVWLYPPSRREELHGHTLDQWVSKAQREFHKGATILALLPARPWVGWFHDFVTQSTAFTFVRDPYVIENDSTPGQITAIWTTDLEVKLRYLDISDKNGLTVETGL